MQKKLTSETISLQGDQACRASARVLPALGANLVSFRVDGIEYIYWDEQSYISDNKFSGGFNMFPTPCRLAGCSYQFEDRQIVQQKHGEKIFIHGLIRDEVMTIRNEGNSITSWLDITPEHPVFEGFPFKSRVTLKHILAETAIPVTSTSSETQKQLTYPTLTVSFKVENMDTRNMPFGYGLHPYWRIHGGRKDVMIRIPCDYVMEVKDLVPTGRYLPVSGTAKDLKSATNLENMALDNVYWERKPGDKGEIIFTSIKKKIIIEAGDEFTHMIAYTPPDKDFFCVENLTCSPNAQNLVASGKGGAAHMIVVPPGCTAQSWIRYSVEPLT